MNGSPIRVIIDGAVFERSPFGGACRYIRALSLALCGDGLSVSTWMEGQARSRPGFEPINPISSLEFAPDWWITDQVDRVSRWDKCRRVLIVHDLIDLEFPDLIPPSSGLPLSQDQLLAAILPSQMIVTPSHATAVRLAAHQLDKRPIFPLVFLCGTHSQTDTIHSRNPRQLLHVGGRLGYKNFQILIEALPFLDGCSLVSVGGDVRRDDELAEIAERLSVLNRIKLYGFVEEQELRRLFASASCLVQPSLCEGSALTLREAINAGLPVAASAIPAFLEFDCPHVHYFDPGSPRSVMQVVKETIDDNQWIPQETQGEAFSKDELCAFLLALETE